MRRPIARFAVSSLTLVSLLLFLATGLLWARSYGFSDHLAWTRHSIDDHSVTRRSLTFRTGRGGLACEFFSATDVVPPEAIAGLWQQLQPHSKVEHQATHPPAHPLHQGGLLINAWTPPKSRPTSWWNRVGFFGHVTRTSRPPGSLVGARETNTTGHAAAPLWLPFVLFGVLPVGRSVARLRRERAVLAGRCPDCGYDARATPGICPECGRDPATARPPRLLFHSPAAAGAFRVAAMLSLAACACLLLLLVAFAAAAPWFTPMHPAAARQMFFLDTYVSFSPPLSVITLALVAALLPALRLALSARRRPFAA